MLPMGKRLETLDGKDYSKDNKQRDRGIEGVGWLALRARGLTLGNIGHSRCRC